MPRQFRNRGDRLVFSNGIVVLAALSCVLLIVFDAQVSRLIQLYVVGVFTAFTLSQAGMVRHWLRTREPHWRRSVLINGIGALTTGLVLVIVAVVKFSHGAWIVIAAIPVFVAGMLSIRRHYLGVAAQLRAIPVTARVRPTRVLVLVAHPDERTDRALRYATMVRAEAVRCIHAEEDGSAGLTAVWDVAHSDHKLEVLPGTTSIARRISDRVRHERLEHPEGTVTVVMGDRINNRLRDLLSHRHSLAIKARLLFAPGVVVTDLNVLRRSWKTALPPVSINRVEQVVLIADMTRPIREALSYAQGLATPVTAVHVDVDAEASERVVRHWAAAGYDFSLEVIPSPYRRIVEPLAHYLRERRRRALPGTLICAVIPEFVVPGRLAQLLHNQTGLAIKRALAGEVGIAVTSVPFHLKEEEDPAVAGTARSGAIAPIDGTVDGHATNPLERVSVSLGDRQGSVVTTGDALPPSR